MAHPRLADVRGVLFDKDGTLIDFERSFAPAVAAAILELAAGDRHLAEALAVAAAFDLGSQAFDPASPLIAGTADDFASDWAGLLGVAPSRAFTVGIDRRFAAHIPATLTPIGDPAALCQSLAEGGYALGIATNDLEENAHIQARALGFDTHFAFVAGYDSGHGAKPGPGQVLAFAAAIDIPPATVAMVGDSVHDMQAARAAGALAIAVMSGPNGRDAARHADIVLQTAHDLFPVLLESGARPA